jgi:hypothetical protein
MAVLPICGFQVTNISSIGSLILFSWPSIAIQVDSQLKLFLVGSFRRGEESCEDIHSKSIQPGILIAFSCNKCVSEKGNGYACLCFSVPSDSHLNKRRPRARWYNVPRFHVALIRATQERWLDHPRTLNREKSGKKQSDGFVVFMRYKSTWLL